MDTFIATVKKVTGYTLIVSVCVLTFFAILSIWEVLESDVSGKAIGSMMLIGAVSLLFFAAAAVIQYDPAQGRKGLSLVWIILIIIGSIIAIPWIFSLFFFGLRSSW